MRLRVVFEKGEEVKFISHLDTARTFARAMRRAGIPVSHSRGFNPHPKISFALPLPVGVTSENDVLDVELASPMEVGEFIRRLNAALPPGLRVDAAREVSEDAPSLMSIVDAARYEVRAPIFGDVDPKAVVARFVESTSIIVHRQREGHPAQEVDIRPLILSLDAERVDGDVVIDMVLRSGSRGSARADEVLRALDDLGGRWLDLTKARYRRKGVYEAAESGLGLIRQ